MAVKNYQVAGMTCGHSEKSVREEDSEVSGEGFTDEAVTAAIEEAGYKLA